MTQMGLDIETIEHLDFAPPCDDKECDRAAEWTLRVSCCGHLWLMCETHKVQTQNFVTNHLEWVIECDVCHKKTKCKEFYLSFDKL